MWCFRLCFFSLTNFELLQSQKIFCPFLKEPRQPEPEVSLFAWTWLTCEATGPTGNRRWSSPAARSRGEGRIRRMGCSISGLNALYESATGGGDVWINERRFRVLRQIGEGGFAFVYLVRELQPASDAEPARRHAAHVSGPPASP